MMRSIACLIFTLWWLPELILARESIQDRWIIPDGKQDDFTTTFRNGDSIPISWAGWGDSWVNQYLDGEKLNDLWVTSFDYNIVPFNKLLTRNINISQSDEYTWKIDIEKSTLSKTAKYVLRFKNPAEPRDSYDHETPQLSSNGFIILAESPTSTPTDAPTETPSPGGGLSTGAKAGIGVGVGVGVLVAICVGVFALLSRRRKRVLAVKSSESPGNQSSRPMLGYYNEQQDDRPITQFAELPNHASKPTELPSDH